MKRTSELPALKAEINSLNSMIDGAVSVRPAEKKWKFE